MWKKPRLGLPIYIAVDDLVSDTENEYEAIWHYDTDGASVADGRFVSRDITQFICGAKGDMSIVAGVREPEMQGWICRSSLQGSEQPIPTLLHKVKGSSIRTVNVFVLHENGVCSVAGAELNGNTVVITYSDGSEDRVKI